MHIVNKIYYMPMDCFYVFADLIYSTLIPASNRVSSFPADARNFCLHQCGIEQQNITPHQKVE